MTSKTDKHLQADLDAAREFLKDLLAPKISEKDQDWLQHKLDKIKQDGFGRAFLMAFSGAPRFIGKEAISPSEAVLQKAEALRTGFRPQAWTADQTVRILFLLYLPVDSPEAYQNKLDRIFETADMNEQVALFSAFPLLAYPERLIARTMEGLRTNMTVVFDAIALENPYATDFLEEAAWNQMFLKAAFLDRPLYRIHGVQQRANADLARIVSDYAHERWAAGRVVSPELWRPVSKFVDQTILEDLQKLFTQEEFQKQAATLACAQSENEEAQRLLSQHPEFLAQVEKGELTWITLGQAWRESKGEN